MSEEKRIFEYFVVAGVPDEPEELTSGAQECGYKETTPQPPVTDICVIFPSLGEQVPDGFTKIESTPSGFSADLNHGSLRSVQCYLCYKRGFHKPPLTDIGVMYEGRGERVNTDSQLLKTTPYGRSANVNNASQGIYLTYRRAADNAPSNLFAVTDICVILTNKNEAPPHTFYKINRNLNKGMVGSDVYICYKKSLSSSSRIAYKPAILDRFPEHDYEEYSLPPSVPLFGLPMGAVIECWPAKNQTPTREFSTFVLTDQKGRKLYGAAVTFYENYTKPLSIEQLEKLGLQPDAQLRSGSCSDSTSTNDPAEQMTFHTNKCICLVSRYPFFNSFKRFLYWLHRMAVIGRYSLPIERYISHLMYEVPFPTARRPRIMVQIGNERILFDNPEDSPLPINGASYVDSLRLLGAENYMYLMMLTLLEQKILVHTLRSWHLTSVAEALTTLIFPFHWQCPYIPQCPLDLAGVLHAPLPFVVGVDSRYFELYEDPPRDVTSVDLDTNTISQSEVRQKIKLTLLPRRAAKLLRQQLDALEVKVMQEEFKVREIRSSYTQGFLPVEMDLRMHHRRRGLELQIQEACLRFMISIMKGYQHYLKPLRTQPQVGATDLEALFDVNAFLRSRDRSSHEFYKHLLNTQLFIRFIEERSFLSDKDRNAYLAFFDECMEKVDLLPTPSSVSIASPPRPHPSPIMGLLPTSVEQNAQDLHPNQDSAHFLLEFDENPSQFENAVLFAPPEIGQSIENQSTYCYAFGGFPKLKMEHFALDRLIREDKGRGIQQDLPSSLLDTNLALQRTRQEAKAALKLARQQSNHPIDWAKCLLGYACSLWFMHLPSFLISCQNGIRNVDISSASLNKLMLKRLKIAYEILDRILIARLPLGDEVCFRVLIQACGRYGHPLMAVKVFLDMKRLGVQPNAITYGFYNRAVLEAQWPSSTTLSAQRCWALLRNALRAVARFRRPLKACGRRGHERRALRVQSADDGAHDTPSALDASPLKNVTENSKLNIDAKNRAAFDLGYHSQSTWDDGASSDVASGLVNFMQPSNGNRLHVNEAAESSIKRSHSIPIRMGAALKLPNYFAPRSDYMSDALDHSKPHYRRLLSTTAAISVRKGSLNLPPGLSSYDSPAGLLITADHFLSFRLKNDASFSTFDDSVFEHCHVGSKEIGPVRSDAGSASGMDADRMSVKCDANDQGTEFDFKNATRKIDSYSENHSDHVRPVSFDKSIESNPPISIESLKTIVDDKTTPAASARTAVTENDPLNSSSLFAAEAYSSTVVTSPAAQLATMQTPRRENTDAEARKRLLFDKKPFEDEFDLSNRKKIATPTSSFGLGLSRLGRDSVRNFFNRLTTTPTRASPTLWTKVPDYAASETLEESKQTSDVSLENIAATPPPGRTAATTSFASAPSSSGAHITRLLKSGVASMVNDFRALRGSVNEAAAPLLRSSLSSLALAAAASESSAAAAFATASFGIVVDDSVTTSSLDGVSISSSNDAADRPYVRTTALELEELASQDDTTVAGRHDLRYEADALYTDPAFQLSDIHSLMRYRREYNCMTNNPSLLTDNKTDFAPVYSILQFSDSYGRAKYSIAALDRLTPLNVNDRTNAEDEKDPPLIDVALCVSTRCPHCLTFCVDEEIMAGWMPDESELTTHCQFCEGKFVPQITVEIRRTTLRKFRADSWYVRMVDGESERRFDSTKNKLNSETPSRVDLSSTQHVYPDSVNRTCSTNKFESNISDLASFSSLALNESDSRIGQRDRSNSLGDLASTPTSSFRSSRCAQSVLFRQMVNNQRKRRNLFPFNEDQNECNHNEKTHQYSNSSDNLLLPRENVKGIVSEGHKSPPPCSKHHVTVPYLCPIVLRKELETVMSGEGDDCLSRAAFVDQHPIIYWNLLYFFQRIDSPTHLAQFLPPFLANEGIFEKDPQFEAKLPVFVRCVYDLSHLHKNDPAKPLLCCDDFLSQSESIIPESKSSLVSALLSDENRSPNRASSRAVASQILDYLRVPNLHKPIMLMINEHRKRAPPKRPNPSTLPRHFSIYRDINLLSLSVYGKTLLLDEFEHEYEAAFAKLPPKIASMLPTKDRAPAFHVRACRKIFVPLDAN